MPVALLMLITHLAAGAHEKEISFIKVGLFQDALVSRVVVYCSEGEYILVGDREEKARLASGDILYLNLENDSIRLLDRFRDYGSVHHLELKALGAGARFRMRPLEPELKSRVYDGSLEAGAGDRYLELVNRVDLDFYLAGVVESEGGTGAPAAFYRAQAILCRTYTLKHMHRHEAEGFYLCDQVHCQAFKGRHGSDPAILEAVLETTGVVATDHHYKLIMAAYHSNSGGQTTRSRDVWLEDLPYLQSVVDPYSLHQHHAKWTDTISFSEWKDYLSGMGMKAVGRIPEEILYVEQMRRKKYFILDGDSLRMTKIREDWGFPSAFFDMFPEGDSVLVWGKGYGHGIGMSQEGAMKMAGDGFSHEDILKFYYHEIRLMDYRDLPSSSISMIPEL